jgi:hypothetical protein
MCSTISSGTAGAVLGSAGQRQQQPGQTADRRQTQQMGTPSLAGEELLRQLVVALTHDLEHALRGQRRVSPVDAAQG